MLPCQGLFNDEFSVPLPGRTNYSNDILGHPRDWSQPVRSASGNMAARSSWSSNYKGVTTNHDCADGIFSDKLCVLLSFDLPLLQFNPADFPRRGHGYRVDEFDFSRIFIKSKVLLDMFLEFLCQIV